ncbi:MAG: hypothetical protein E7456_05120 [Ruminococcaceae bacterium]|nr:hypothetical protein [Oscillospiraceae bacterium]
MDNFWDYSVWGGITLIASLLISLVIANALKRKIKLLHNSLIPTSVLAGIILLCVSEIFKLITGDILFEAAVFGGKGTNSLEIITYHALALGFIATTFQSGQHKANRERNIEIFNTGVTTVSTYLLQAIFGFGITLIVARLVSGFFEAAGVLLPFGFGQGTGQALNYGSIYESQYGFTGGKSFGLTIAAMGFLFASIGGVIHLNVLKKRGKVTPFVEKAEVMSADEIQTSDEIPMNGSMDKLTVQVALIIIAYIVTYILMVLVGSLLPGMRSVIYGFNFLFGVLIAALIKVILRAMQKTRISTRKYVNSFLMQRIGNFCFDIMVTAGIAAIRMEALADYWVILLILGITGAVTTYFYLRYVSVSLFKKYPEEQFLAMYGMLTGTASTGVVLLREIDGKFQTPAADNLVYQNFPAIVFGFPMMLLATLAPQQPILTFIILVAFFAVMNVILFRSRIFKSKKKTVAAK